MKIQTIAKLIPVLLVTTGSFVKAQDSTVTELEGKANNGSAIAQYDLGKMYADGTGVKKNYKKASEWIRKAASQDNFDAQLFLGYMHGKGMGVKQDYDEAWKWINRAIMKFSPSLDKDEPNFEMIVEWMYEKGWNAKREFISSIDGSYQNYQISLKWNFYAAQLGHAPARKRIYEFAAKYRCPYAKTLMGELFFIGKGVEKDDKMAFKFFQKAATTVNNDRMVRAAYTIGEDEGYPPAQCVLGELYFKGIHVQKNYTEAEKWFTRAAKQGNLKAQLNLGSMYSNGRGVKKDLKKAEKWYKEAARQGNEYARDWLKKNKK